MWGSINGKPFGSPAGDEEIRKLLQPLLDRHDGATIGHGPDGAFMEYHGRKYDLDTTYDISRPYMIHLLEIDLDKNDEYDRWLEECNSSMEKPYDII